MIGKETELTGELPEEGDELEGLVEKEVFLSTELLGCIAHSPYKREIKNVLDSTWPDKHELPGRCYFCQL
ncbi:Uncharacterized protein NCS13_1_1641 [Neochlamydia sp. S13]|nr:Uncharacterized protein NCS13_1_1641 [Neochlamydia sp. S13]